MIYSTYLGGGGTDQGTGIAVDSSNNIYVTGFTDSSGATSFPTKNPYQTNAGGRDAFLVKLDATGKNLVYGTYLGGDSQDVGNAVAVDSSDNAYATGFTDSTNFKTLNPFQPNLPLRDAWVCKFSPAGAATFVTYLGADGVDEGNAIAVRGDGVYIAGSTDSTEFPVLNGFQPLRKGNKDAFIEKMKLDGSGVIYGTYLGGSGEDVATGIAVDGAGSAYVTGWTKSGDFPPMNPFQPALKGPQDAFLTKFAPAGNALVYSTYFGGTATDQGNAIAVNSAGEAYITGFTTSGDLLLAAPIQTRQAQDDAFVTKFDADGRGLTYSTYYGGQKFDRAQGIALDPNGIAYIAGWTNSPPTPTPNFLVVNNGAFGATLHGEYDAFVAKITTPRVSFLNNLNLPYDPSALGVSNFVTTNGLPTKEATAFDTANVDPENFRIEVFDPNVAAGQVTVTVEVLRNNQRVLGPTNYALSYKQGALFRGYYLRLVSDTVDDAASGRDATTDNTTDNQTILVQLGDLVRLTYTPTGDTPVTASLLVGRPVSEDNNDPARPDLHDIRELKVNVVVFRNVAGTAPIATRAQVEADIATTNERFAQSGIKLNVLNRRHAAKVGASS